MTDFKVGDLVQLNLPATPYHGQVGPIVEINREGMWPYFVKWPSSSGPLCYPASHLKPADKFKLGDRVRCHSMKTCNGVGTVIEVDGSEYIRVRYDDGQDSLHTGERWCVTDNFDKIEDRFKPGDRVRYTYDKYVFPDQREATIVRRDDSLGVTPFSTEAPTEGYVITFDHERHYDVEGYAKAEYLELIEDEKTVTISVTAYHRLCNAERTLNETRAALKSLLAE